MRYHFEYSLSEKDHLEFDRHYLRTSNVMRIKWKIIQTILCAIMLAVTMHMPVMGDTATDACFPSSDEITIAWPFAAPSQIQIVDRANPDKPQTLHIGDTFGGFTLEHIESWFTSGLPTPIHASFSGEQVVTGTLLGLRGCSTSPGIYALSFRPHEPYHELFPMYYRPWTGSSILSFTYYNVAEVATMLGLSQSAIRAIGNERITYLRAEDVTLRVGNFFLSNSLPAGHVGIMEVLSIGELAVRRRYQNVYIGSGIAVFIVVGVALSTWQFIKRKRKKV